MTEQYKKNTDLNNWHGNAKQEYLSGGQIPLKKLS